MVVKGLLELLRQPRLRRFAIDVVVEHDFE
jgi:hypothetical protein